ncbi:hypothetical protein PVNG_03847 [Plasmodium vivax North Korean]|uniref:Variable surface protein Vir10-like protein n=1 Tax=Plasmodium vivax North Korean TaxID=1035514 RepID=A0A0J9WDD1_PLAVI|nr:hypothetical protein PVNG_03847 [Plasmodium vivax North Korean]
MVLLSNCNLGKNVIFSRFLKYFTFTFLIWIYLNCNDLGKFPKSLENEFREDKKLNLIFKRLLAKHDLQSELQHGYLREKLSDNVSIYGQIKKKKPDNFEAYINDYKRRYRKKKGLFKLDCYCEKKIFDKILYVKELSEKVHYDRKRFKNIFLKKYGIGLILFSLIPALGFILPILFGVGNREGVLTFCNQSGHDSESGVSSNNSGKGKMNLMEYCRFCKELL